MVATVFENSQYEFLKTVVTMAVCTHSKDAESDAYYIIIRGPGKSETWYQPKCCQAGIPLQCQTCSFNIDARKQPGLQTWTPSSLTHSALPVQPSSTPSLESSNWTKMMLIVSNDI